MKINKAAKLPAYDLQILEGWYEHMGRSRGSNLVVVLQDLETFESDVLQDFISICSEYRRRLPIVFVMGIATSSEILHQSLTKSSIGLLRVEKFWLEQSEVWFNRVLETIFIDTIDTMKFGPRPYKFLLDHFYLYDFSMGKVTASLKYALMHHFYGNPLSIFLPLMSYSDSAEVNKTLEEWYASGILSTHHAAHIRMLPSFRMHVDTLADQDPHKALRLLDDDAYLFTEALSEFVGGLQRYQVEFRYGIELIRVLEGQFSGNVGLKKPKWKLLQMALDSKDGLSHSEVILWPSSLVRKLDADRLGELLHDIYAIVKQFEGARGEKRTAEVVRGWIERLQALQGDMDEPTLRRTETAKKVQSDSVDHLKQQGTDRTRIAIEVADWISQTLKQYLRSFTDVPLYELVYYTNVKLHEKSFSAQPRAAVQTGLGQAHHYLNCACCNKLKDSRGHILPSEPDASILYKLYLECGRLINLYDWFVAFGCILEREKRSDRLEEKEVQARFVRSVAELQFLGFIKPTQRKTDHVQRLTWSNA
ncbi:origin recognition complex subunit 3 N-terminus-domain-containing protein [Dichotomocladium elegans]|nr:origin recognition complex subunit 3 N-terminus-domain-containing protein [Dichotomocladium elegans]